MWIYDVSFGDRKSATYKMMTQLLMHQYRYWCQVSVWFLFSPFLWEIPCDTIQQCLDAVFMRECEDSWTVCEEQYQHKWPLKWTQCVVNVDNSQHLHFKDLICCSAYSGQLPSCSLLKTVSKHSVKCFIRLLVLYKNAVVTPFEVF